MHDRAELVAVMEGVLSTPEGRELVFALAEDCLRDLQNIKSDIHKQYLALGRQEIGHYIMALAKEANPQAAADYIKKQGESMRHERAKR